MTVRQGHLADTPRGSHGMNLPAHGNYSRYIHHSCRCQPCRAAVRTYRRRLSYDHSNGNPRRIDSTPTRTHLKQLTARGWTHAQIAAAAGLNGSTVSDVLSGRYATVQRRTAESILGIAVDQTPPIPRRTADATGTRRRLQALMVLGYSIADIARRVGVGVTSLEQTADGRWNRVHVTTAGKVARVYRQLSTTPAPPTLWAEKARNHAMTAGWHGPMAWADIDDPACKPDPAELPAPGHVHADDVTELAARGLDDHQIAKRLGVSARTVLRARAAYNIPAAVA